MSRQKPSEAGASEGARRATGEASASPTRATGRWSARRKMSVVLELLRGADLESPQPSPWRDGRKDLRSGVTRFSPAARRT